MNKCSGHARLTCTPGNSMFFFTGPARTISFGANDVPRSGWQGAIEAAEAAVQALAHDAQCFHKPVDIFVNKLGFVGKSSVAKKFSDRRTCRRAMYISQKINDLGD